MEYSAIYRNIYLALLTPTEILNFKAENNLINELNYFSENTYIKQLTNTLSKGEDADVLCKYGNVSGFTMEDMITMTTKIDDPGGSFTYSPWFKAFIDISKNTSTPYIYASKNPFIHFFTPFLDYFSEEIKNNKKTTALSTLSSLVLDQLRLLLYNDLYNLSQFALFEEFNYFKNKYFNFENHYKNSDILYKKFISVQLENGYISFFSKYPVLLRKILFKLKNYLDFIPSLLNKLGSDKEDIETTFCIQIDCIKEIHLNTGDLHNGSATVIFEFENRTKILYKPCDVGITEAYNSLIAWVNNKLCERLKTFKVVNRKGYGWIQFINYEGCSTKHEVKSYYERAGILLAVAYFLNANDLHYENIIASGDSPVLIDHETLLSPKLRNMYPGNGGNSLTIMGTVLETSLIPVKELNLPYYGYGYGSSSIPPELLIKVPVAEHPNTDSMRLVPTTIPQDTVKQNKPVLEGRVVNLKDYKDEFRNGFKRMYQLVLSEREFLLSKHSPLILFKSQSIRIINRQTKVYHKILKLLNTPEYLSDAIKYGIKLEVLAKAYLQSNKYSKVLSLEREQLLADNIPVFYMNTSGKDTAFFDNDVVELSAFENLLKKIINASINDYCTQDRLIENSVNL